MGLGPDSRLYYTDSYLRQFTARVTDRAEGGLRVYLDRTAFYPTSGGQPNDTGTIGGVRVLDVVDEDERIAHVLEAPAGDGELDCRIDWPRRFDHMQQHSGQHLLSAVLFDLFGMQTVGFHLGADESQIDLSAPSIEPAQISAAESRANEIVFENRPVSVSFEEQSEELGLRKASKREGTLRIVSIADCDRSACGGTHVRATGEIGPVLIRKIERVHGNARVHFLCGGRAVGRARADYESLSQIARSFAARLDETPALVAAQAETLKAAEKTNLALTRELAKYRGRELYEQTAPGEDGIRRFVEKRAKGGIDDELRVLAQSFAGQSKAVFTAVIEEPPALLLAVSKDSGVNAGALVKAAVTAAGGRGGGSPLIAQGGVPTVEALRQVEQALRV